MVAEDITVLSIGFTEVTIYEFPGEEYAFRRRKHFSVVVSWSTPFHGRERPTEKSFSVVVRQQAEGLVVCLERTSRCSKTNSIYFAQSYTVSLAS